MKIIKGYKHFLFEAYNQSISSKGRAEAMNNLLNKEWLDVKITTTKSRLSTDIIMQVEFFIESFNLHNAGLSDRRALSFLLQLKINADKSMTFMPDQYINGYWYKIYFKNAEKIPLMAKTIEVIDNEIKEDPSIIKQWQDIPKPFFSKYPQYGTAKDLDLL